MIKKLYKILAVLLTGFVGGAMSPWILGWLKGVQVDSVSDAVSIANTYIVFTTIIFVGVTVVFAIAGYVFSQQFSTSKQSQETHLIDELKEKIKKDESVGIALANAILENSDVKRHLKEKLESKVDDLIQERLTDSNTPIGETVEGIASQLNGESL